MDAGADGGIMDHECRGLFIFPRVFAQLYKRLRDYITFSLDNALNAFRNEFSMFDCVRWWQRAYALCAGRGCK